MEARLDLRAEALNQHDGRDNKHTFANLSTQNLNHNTTILQEQESNWTRGYHHHDSPSQPNSASRASDSRNLRHERVLSDNTGLSSQAPSRRGHKSTASASVGTANTNKPLKTAIPRNSDHMRRLSGIPKTLSFSSFHSTRPDSDHQITPNTTASDPEEPIRPSSSHSSNPASSAPLPPAHSDPRSPSQKRKPKPPASHSSYGVGTYHGPPPSYSTQRTLSQDRIRTTLDRNNNPATSTKAVTTASDRVPPSINEVTDATNALLQVSELTDKPNTLTLGPPLKPQLSDSSITDSADEYTLATSKAESEMTPPTSASTTRLDDTEVTSRNLMVDGPHDDGKISSSDETHKSSEDLFLNIAKTDSARLGPSSSSRMDKRRSRISLPFFSNNRPASSPKSASIPPPLDSDTLRPQTEIPRHLSKRSSLGQHVPGALTSSQYFDDTRSHIGIPMGQSSNLDSDARSQVRSRRYSNATVDNPRPPTRSFTSRTSRLVSENLYGDRFKPVEQPATESTISTTAPSTVWDELDDLKSRIRKLELTGKLPPSSAAAMTSDRPRTATTQATTMSSSPKHSKPAVDAMPSQIEGIPSTTHPLLHEALNNGKGVMSAEVYQKLQATAQDALQLSTMMTHEHTGSSSMSPQAERQIRRRTESMCRSLTELAIALLAEARPTNANSPANRPPSRDTASIQNIRNRAFSNEPADRQNAASRVQSRLESRRTSLHISHSPSTALAPTQPSFDTPAASVVSQSFASTRLPRSSTVNRHRRAQQNLDGASDDTDSSPGIRPVSRAMTDIQQGNRPSPRDRTLFSREYTKQHPLPSPTLEALPQMKNQPQSPGPQQTNFVSRRAYQSPAGTATAPSAHTLSHLSRLYDSSGSSPITPSSNQTMSYSQRPAFTISIERKNSGDSPLSAGQSSENVNSAARASNSASTRRSLGFTSRISNVSSRLKAARAERMANSSATRTPLKDDVAADGDRVSLAAEDEPENKPPARMQEVNS